MRRVDSGGRRRRAGVALWAVLCLLLAACSGAEDAASSADAASPGAGEGAGEAAAAPSPAGDAPEGDPSVITFAFAPDPVIDYLRDTGELDRMQEEWNVRLEMTEAWDEFAFFAGGHGQVVSMATYDLPLLEDESNVDTVTFGKYNMNRLPVLVQADSEYQTLEDLVGQSMVVGSVASSTLIWGALAAEMHGTDLRFEGGDYDVTLSDHAVNPDLVARGEAEACICIPEFATPQLRSGELRALYDGRGAAEVYATEVDPGHEGVLSNAFVAEAEWFRSHPHEVDFFLALWERGLELWQENQAEIIERYPQHFSVETPEDIEYVQDVLIAEHDWFVDSVYLDEQWIEGELGLFELLSEHGFAPELPSEELPEFAVVEPA